MSHSTSAGHESRSDARLAGTDREAVRYHAFCADRLLALLELSAGDRLLDLAAGSGVLAMAASQVVGAEGRVTAVDHSEPMLAHLEAKLAQFGITNIDIHVMNGVTLDFRRDYFHCVVCSLGLDRFAAPQAVVAEARRVLRPGGRFGCSSLARAVFQPQLDLLQQQIGQRGSGVPDLPWAGTDTPQALSGLLTSAGFTDVAVHEFNTGYRLGDAEQWWDVVRYSSLHRWLEPLTPKDRQELHSRHVREIADLVTSDGLWLDVPVIMAIGRK